MFAYPEYAIGLIQTHFFISLTIFIGIPNSMIILYQTSPTWILRFLEVYTYLVHCYIVFPLFLNIFYL
jgi:hypothetical protein